MSTYDICILILEGAAMLVGAAMLPGGFFVQRLQPWTVEPEVQLLRVERSRYADPRPARDHDVL